MMQNMYKDIAFFPQPRLSDTVAIGVDHKTKPQSRSSPVGYLPTLYVKNTLKQVCKFLFLSTH